MYTQGIDKHVEDYDYRYHRGKHNSVAGDPKMTIVYQLAWLLASGGGWTAFPHSTRRVALSPYPRTAIGSARYRNNITTTALLNPNTPSPKPVGLGAGDELYVGLRLVVDEYEKLPDMTVNYDSKFTLGNINLASAYYRK